MYKICTEISLIWGYEPVFHVVEFRESENSTGVIQDAETGTSVTSEAHKEEVLPNARTSKMCIKDFWETDMSSVQPPNTHKKGTEKLTVINPYSLHCTIATSNNLSAEYPAQISLRKHGLIRFNMNAWSGHCAVSGKQGLVSMSAALNQSPRKESVLRMV